MRKACRVFPRRSPIGATASPQLVHDERDVSVELHVVKRGRCIEPPVAVPPLGQAADLRPQRSCSGGALVDYTKLFRSMPSFRILL
jgi:hypothetical protein